MNAAGYPWKIPDRIIFCTSSVTPAIRMVRGRMIETSGNHNRGRSRMAYCSRSYLWFVIRIF